MKDIKVYHVRAYNKNGVSPYGGMTVAIRENGDTMDAGIAYCSGMDNYCRRIGTLIATGRLLRGRRRHRHIGLQKADLVKFLKWAAAWGPQKWKETMAERGPLELRLNGKLIGIFGG